MLELLECGVDNKLSIDAGYAHLRDGSLKWDVGGSEGCTGGKSGEGVWHVDAVG